MLVIPQVLDTAEAFLAPQEVTSAIQHPSHRVKEKNCHEDSFVNTSNSGSQLPRLILAQKYILSFRIAQT
jgi:hypothetical protein